MSNVKALAAKDKGNAAFKAADYPTAIGHYTTAILADRKDPTYPLNRAAAYLKLGKFADAERDCNTVLELSANNVKALFRRGQARFGLDQLENARDDFSDIIKREPSNTAAHEELKKTLVQIQSKKAKAAVSPVLATLDPTFAAKRRRVPIRIVDADGKAWNPSNDSKSAAESKSAPSPQQPLAQPQPKPEAPKATITTKPISSPNTLESVSSRSIKDETSSSQPTKSPASPPETKPTTPAAPSPPASKPATFQDAKQARETKTARVGGGIFRRSGENTIFETRNQPVPPKTSPSTTASTAPKVPSPPKQEPPATLINFAASLNGGDLSVKAPKSFVEFARLWNSSSLEGKWKLINTIPPAKFPELCSSSLESPLLVDILRVFSKVLQSPTTDNTIKATVMDYMVNFGKIKRFSTLLLFFLPSEKAIAREVWELLGKRPEGLWASVV